MGSGRWAVGSGQWAVGSGRWEVVSGQSPDRLLLFTIDHLLFTTVHP